MPSIPLVLTIEDIAERLLTTPENVVTELEAGNLEGFKIGGQWRVSETALLKFMGLSTLATLNPEETSEMSIASTVMHSTPPPTQPPDINSLLEGREWERFPDFPYQWPVGVERYSGAVQTRVSIGTREYPVIIGFCQRESAGDPERRRAVVFMGHLPSLNALVEFSGENSDVFETTGRMASVIKLPTGKHLKPGDPIPSQYVGLPVESYKSIVRGPYAAASMAVVAQKDDYRLMAHHGLIRARERKLI